MNKVILMGRLTRDAEVRYSQGENSTAIARFSLAVDRRFRRDGDEQTADFINCVAWGAMAEFAEKYMKKGVMFAVVGRLNVRSWEKDGERHWTTTVVVENCYFTGSKRDAESKPAQSKPAAQTGKQMGLAEQEGFYPIEESVEDDDLPF